MPSPTAPPPAEIDPFTLPRTDHAGGCREAWQPPAYDPPGFSLRAVARRCLDLQAASIWADLGPLLRHARGTVLDVGCGAQPYRRLLPPGVTYLGVDTEDALARFGYRTPDTAYYAGDALPVPGASVDVLLCTETLEHVPDSAPFLAELRRCLRPGGRAILTVPFAARWHYVPHDYWRFTPSALTRLLAAAGFDKVAVYPRGNAVTVACYKGMALVLPLLMPQSGGTLGRALKRVAGLALSPVVVGLAAIGQLSLRRDGGTDCLGYTVVATAPGPGKDDRPC